MRVEISALREMCDRGEITIHWICKHRKLSHLLTKKKTNYQPLVEVLQKTKIPPYNYDTDQIWLTDFIKAWFFIYCINFSEHYKLNLVNLVLLECHSQMEY